MSGFFFIHWAEDRRPEGDPLAFASQKLSRRSPGGVQRFDGPSSTILQGVRAGAKLANVARDGSVILAGTVRLDDREALAAQFGCDAAKCSDAELALVAYRAEGCEGIAKLLGDFSFLIFDEREGIVAAFRDHFGVKPLYYYHVPGHSFVVASDLIALLAAPGLDLTADDTTIARFAAGLFSELGRTAYRHVRSVPPGSALTVSEGLPRIDRYYDVPLRTPRPPNVEDVQRLSDLLQMAVADRLKSEPDAAAMLSGGLDSSTIVGFASRIREARAQAPLETYSMVFPDNPAVDESRYIKATAASLPISPHYIDCSKLKPFADVNAFIERQAGPVVAPASSLSREVWRAVAGDGHRALFSGHGGDDIISFGIENLVEHAKTGHWRELWRDAAGLRPHLEASRLWTFVSLWSRHHAGGRWLRHLAAKIISPFRKRGAAEVPRPDSASPPEDTPMPLVRPLHQKPGALAALPIAARLYAEKVFHPLQGNAFEILDLEMAEFGITPLYPFLDRRVVEFCLDMSPALRLRNGWSRWILREVLNGKVPDMVRWRRDKTNFISVLSKALERDGKEAVRPTLVGERSALARFMGQQKVDGYIKLLAQRRRRNSKPSNIWRAYVLGRWLSRNAQSSTV